MTDADYSIIKMQHDQEAPATWSATDCAENAADAADLINQQNKTIGVLIGEIDRMRSMVIIDHATVCDQWGFDEGMLLNEYDRQFRIIRHLPPYHD